MGRSVLMEADVLPFVPTVEVRFSPFSDEAFNDVDEIDLDFISFVIIGVILFNLNTDVL